MALNYWLVKSEASDYSWDRFVQDGRAAWTRIRNFQARENLRKMKRKDLAFFYHTGPDKEIVGIAEVAREHFPDPEAEPSDGWLAVDLVPVRPLKKPVSLARIKAETPLVDMVLRRSPRLSVQPVTKEEWRYVLQLSR